MYPPNNAYPKCSAPPQPTAPQPAPPQFQNQSTGISICTPMQIQYLAPGPWSTGLCHCCDDVTNCCITCWCPCITFGQIAEIVDRGTTSCATSGALYALIRFLTGCSCVYSCCYRTKMRGQYFLSESPCADCFVHCCCELCALCQEYRELKNRGFDMSLGWHGSLLRQNCAVTVPPAMVPGMNRY